MKVSEFMWSNRTGAGGGRWKYFNIGRSCWVSADGFEVWVREERAHSELESAFLPKSRVYSPDELSSR